MVSGLHHVTKVMENVIPSAPLLFGLHVPCQCWWWAVTLLSVGGFITGSDGLGCSISSYPNPMRGCMFPDLHTGWKVPQDGKISYIDLVWFLISEEE